MSEFFPTFLGVVQSPWVSSPKAPRWRETGNRNSRHPKSDSANPERYSRPQGRSGASVFFDPIASDPLEVGREGKPFLIVGTPCEPVRRNASVLWCNSFQESNAPSGIRSQKMSECSPPWAGGD